MGVLFKLKVSEFQEQGHDKKEARNKALDFFRVSYTCRSCDSVMKPSEVSRLDNTYCYNCLS
jgi:hypothetical protein